MVSFARERRRGESYLQLASGNILFYRGEEEKDTLCGTGLIVNRKLTLKVEMYVGVSSRVASIIIKIIGKYTLKVIQICPATSATDDEDEVEDP